MQIRFNPLFYDHDTGPGHPESPDRLDAAIAGVRRAGHALHEGSPELDTQTDRIIAKVHSEDYARDVERASASGSGLFHSLDNPISRGTYAAARTAVGTALDAAWNIWRDRVETRAFVIARPPGHHAERELAMGFCFFNTIACVAEGLLELPGVNRVLIYDWDVHHGNGTQRIFEERADVFYVSSHRFPFYPGTGAKQEIGVGRGRGFTRNIPLAAGAGDAAQMSAVEDVVIPLIEDYRPDAILISAGFDAHRRDPLGGMNVTERCFGEMTRLLCDAADRINGGRVLSLLEGGYDPEGLAASVAEHVNALGERPS